MTNYSKFDKRISGYLHIFRVVDFIGYNIY